MTIILYHNHSFFIYYSKGSVSESSSIGSGDKKKKAGGKFMKNDPFDWRCACMGLLSLLVMLLAAALVLLILLYIQYTPKEDSSKCVVVFLFSVNTLIEFAFSLNNVFL